MANDNHLFSVPWYNGTMLTKDYYNGFFEIGQLKINFSLFELDLPDDDPVYALKKAMDLDFQACWPAIQIREEPVLTQSCCILLLPIQNAGRPGC